MKYSTFYGGATASDYATSLAVDPNDPESVTVAGFTWSWDFPTTVGVVKPVVAAPASIGLGPDHRSAFALRFRFPVSGVNPTRVWATYFGGEFEDAASDVAVDGAGNTLLTGWTRSFTMPTTRGAMDRTLAASQVVTRTPSVSGGLVSTQTADAFVARLSADAKTVLYGSYLGGDGDEMDGYDYGFVYSPKIAWAGGDSVLVAGATVAKNFRTTGGAMSESLHDGPSAVDGWTARVSLQPDASGDIAVGVPTLLYPAAGATFQETGWLPLRWSAVSDSSGIESYQWQMSVKPGFDAGWVVQGAAGAGSSGNPPTELLRMDPPAIQTVHYWRVRAVDKAGNIGAWSSAQTVTFGVATGASVVTAVLRDTTVTPRPGAIVTGVVGISAPAPSGGAVIALESLNPALATVPATITIPAGARQVNFPITIASTPIANETNFDLIATYGLARGLTVTVLPQSGNGSLTGLSFDNASVTGNATTLGHVTLSASPTDGGVVTLISSRPELVSVPATVTVLGGSTSTVFSAICQPVLATTPVTVTATYAGGSVSTILTLNAAPAPTVTVSSVTLSPPSVVGGDGSVGTVTLSAPAIGSGAEVLLSSSNSAAAMPLTVFVPAGSISATFSVSTASVATATSANVSATYGGVTRGATLTINPATVTPPAADSVAIQKAEYDASKGTLKIEATSTNASATLTVYVTSTGAQLGTLASSGGGRFSGALSGVAGNPGNITIRSSKGGSASRSVTVK